MLSIVNSKTINYSVSNLKVTSLCYTSYSLHNNTNSKKWDLTFRVSVYTVSYSWYTWRWPVRPKHVVEWTLKSTVVLFELIYGDIIIIQNTTEMAHLRILILNAVYWQTLWLGCEIWETDNVDHDWSILVCHDCRVVKSYRRFGGS